RCSGRRTCHRTLCETQGYLDEGPGGLSLAARTKPRVAAARRHLVFLVDAEGAGRPDVRQLRLRVALDTEGVVPICGLEGRQVKRLVGDVADRRRATPGLAPSGH